MRLRLFKKKKQLPFHLRPWFAKRILEVGPGHNPYEGITHAVEKFPDDNTQRGGDLSVKKGVTLIEGELEALPFRDAERFDFIYASHVLEHIPNPQKAIDELNRLSTRGYIETPSPLREQLCHDYCDYHLLYCWAGPGSEIHVVMKNEQTAGQFCNCSNGQLARQLSRLHREENINIESLLPRKSKYTFFPYRGPLKLHHYDSFQQACDAGHCAYGSVAAVRLWTSFPLYLTQANQRKLHALLKRFNILR